MWDIRVLVASVTCEFAPCRCNMYQLSSSEAMAAEARTQLGAWAAQMGPQDLDLSCIKQSAAG